MGFRPLDDFILVRPQARKQSDVIEVISKERYTRGFVLATGPGKRIKNARGNETGVVRPLTVKPGDFVTYTDLDLFPTYYQYGEALKILQEADIAFICDPEHEAASWTDQQISQFLKAA